MSIKQVSLGMAAAISIFSSCGNSDTTNSNDVSQADTAIAQPEIMISAVEGSPEFADASLGIKDISAKLSGNDSATITINYSVANYTLKQQTTDASSKGCNNSKDGQHIHFILDNAPYQALYEPTKTFKVALNSEHYLMSFLSRSYHESVKQPKAGVLYHFSVDEKGKLTKMDIPNTPMVFYSRPKGDYLGEDTKKLLLDFYVYNTSLSAEGNKVRANINGKDFDIDKWQPYFIENAPMGDLTVKLQLTDKDGKALEGVNTSVSRTAKLATQEPMK